MDISQLIKETKLTISVKANSAKTKIRSWDPEKKVLKIEIKSPAEKNKANLEIIKFFSRLLKKNVKIISGCTSKTKVLKLIEK